MAFHVDYWNYLGWVDPLSDSRYTERQNQYARVIFPRRTYTPQMIINGTRIIVGSDREQGWALIQAALTHTPSCGVTLQSVWKPDTRQMETRFAVSSIPADSLLHLVLVEREIVHPIKKGENQGLVLTHDNVVRSWVSAPLPSSPRSTQGQLMLPVPDDVSLPQTSVIGFVQNSQTFQILGATQNDWSK